MSMGLTSPINDLTSSIIAAAEKANPSRPGDYINPGDGLLYCGLCKTPKQTNIEINGLHQTVFCLCKCAEEHAAQEKREDAERKRTEYIKRLRVQGIMDRALRQYTFSCADNTPVIDKCRRYVTSWERLYADNVGLLLWGNTGNGKTFAAACIANELIDRGIPVMVTSFPRILSALSGLFAEERIRYLDSLPCSFPGRIETPVNDLFFQDRKEAFAPCVVARFADCGKALLPAISSYPLHHLCRRILAAAVAVKDDIGG